ncbi:MAG: glycoside hydrolase family 127 protein [Clostridia bacterium]|nr:glycoside hydrolase family 127 protein [Clostridia bacterium]
MKHPIVEKVYAPGTAYAPHAGTDRFFQLENGSFQFEGILGQAIAFIRDVQLMDTKLWTLFVNQFRKGDTDDWNVGWRCEYWGKMMRGACMVYQCAPDEALYQVIDATVRDMLTTQDAFGRFTTYSKEKELDGWDLWGRKYILLGMQHFLEICRDDALSEKVLEALKRHADAILDTVGPAEEGKKEILLASRHWKGLNSSSLLEPIMRLYNLTGEQRYMDFAHYIVSRGATTAANLFELAYEGELMPYQYPVTKAYEMISNFEGLLEYYRVTGEEKWRTACIHLAENIVKSDVTVIGCSGCTHELFDHSAARQFDIEEKGIMQETCVTVTWMKFCWQMLCLTGESRWADQMEKSLYNALLGSVNTEQVTENNGFPFDSYSPLLPGRRGRKTGGYQVMEDGQSYGCCACIGAAGLGLAGIAQTVCAQEGLYVNFYHPGKVRALTPAGAEVTLCTETAYPAEGDVAITVQPEKAERFVIGLRIPAWSGQTSACVNGEAVSCKAGGYLCIDRVWQPGDRIELCFDMSVRLILPEEYGVTGMPYVALRRGPLVLARDERLGTAVDSPVDIRADENGVACTQAAEAPFPCTVCLSVEQKDGSAFKVVDYASAGKTWTDESRMCAWMLK